jgi:hypothetical protein
MDVIFVSHQWTGYHHPDASGVQLRCLQQALRDLMAGSFHVQNDWAHHLVLHDDLKGESEKVFKQGRKVAEDTYVWLGMINKRRLYGDCLNSFRSPLLAPFLRVLKL